MTHNKKRQRRQRRRTGSETDETGAVRPDTVVREGTSIQDAVDRASAGDVIGVESGAFEEQVVVDKRVSLVGSGSGATTISAPSSLSARILRNGDDISPVVSLESDGAVVRNLTVDGDRRGGGNAGFVGIASYNAGVYISEVEITGVSEEPPSGALHGVGILAYNDDDTERTTKIEDCHVHDYQKGGIVGDGSGLDLHVKKSVVDGSGPTNTVDQNGIQVSSVDRATIAGNTVTDNCYESGGAADGIAVFASDDVLLAWNVIEDNDTGINIHGTSDILVRRNNIESNEIGLRNLGADPFDATNNWWGAADGPSASPGQADGATDPATDAVADGSGDPVYNVHWDPYSDERFNLREDSTDSGGRRSGPLETPSRSHDNR